MYCWCLEYQAVSNTCLLENGDCEHFCDEDKAGQRLNCSCADGYYLDVDGQSCIAKGEREISCIPMTERNLSRKQMIDSYFSSSGYADSEAYFCTPTQKKVYL